MTGVQTCALPILSTVTFTSYPVSMRSNAVNVTVDNPYLGNGPVGQWCCLSTYWGQSSVTNVLRVTGRYTP